MKHFSQHHASSGSLITPGPEELHCEGFNSTLLNTLVLATLVADAGFVHSRRPRINYYRRLNVLSFLVSHVIGYVGPDTSVKRRIRGRTRHLIV
jgi:hypothetical protein